MKLQHFYAASLLAAMSFSISSYAVAATGPGQQQPQVLAHPQTDSTDKTYPIEQIVTATVHDAWLLSGKDEEAFFDIVEQLAQFSAQKRGLTLPDNATAGRRLGAQIKAGAKSDQDQLLYSIVDRAVRSLGTKAGTASAK